MPRLSYVDHRQDPESWAKALGISREAVELYLASEVIDLHVDSYIWTRIFGYDLTKRHGRGLLGARLFWQVDLPRAREAQLSGAMWSVTTNPARPQGSRPRTFLRNLERLKAILESCPDDVAIARDVGEYRAARAAGKHAALLSIQGGNALDTPEAVAQIPDRLVVRVTLVHLSNSRLGVTSAPKVAGGNKGLSDQGKDFVRALNANKILVDLAHINRRGFFDAVEVHDRSQPLIVTHTGVSGVFPHWRNLDDEQLRAIADTGGTVGVMYQSSFLGGAFWGCESRLVIDHLEHIVKTVGEDHASLGSDWDGMILPPRDMPTCLELPRLVQGMLDRGWSAERIQKILGQNFLRTLSLLRGSAEATRRIEA